MGFIGVVPRSGAKINLHFEVILIVHNKYTCECFKYINVGEGPRLHAGCRVYLSCMILIELLQVTEGRPLDGTTVSMAGESSVTAA